MAADVLPKVTKLPAVPFKVTSATNVIPAVTRIDVGLTVFFIPLMVWSVPVPVVVLSVSAPAPLCCNTGPLNCPELGNIAVFGLAEVNDIEGVPPLLLTPG